MIAYVENSARPVTWARDTGTEELQTVSEESDLGVIVLENLKASEQCIKVVNTADSILGMIRRGMTKYRKGPQRSITKTA